MKLTFRTICIATMLVASITVSIHLVSAQTLVTLHSFPNWPTAPAVPANSDGAEPRAGLILSGNTLYGTTYIGGRGGEGSVYRINSDGSGFTNLYSFSTRSGAYPGTNGDGAVPMCRLVLSDDTLYGTTYNGGAFGKGTIFAVRLDGSGFTNLHSFAGAPNDGALPHDGMVLSGTTLYGTTSEELAAGDVIFSINTDGTGYKVLYHFSSKGELTLSGSTLYGVVGDRGAFGDGRIFAARTDGSGTTTVYDFTNVTESYVPTGTLVVSSNALFGTTTGGISGNLYGSIFAVNLDGTGFRILHSFASTDGKGPYTGLILSNNTLFGTTEFGGEQNDGTIFEIQTDGSGFSSLHSFISGPIEGFDVQGILLLANNALYGTTSGGGSTWNGSVFRLSLGPPQPPEITLFPLGGNLIISWSGTPPGLTLQSTTDLGLSSIWTPVSTQPTLVNGQNFVTNSISATRQFFRLSN